jgi:signal transduction histidine kinase/CheY-like chemotaxis protein
MNDYRPEEEWGAVGAPFLKSSLAAQFALLAALLIAAAMAGTAWIDRVGHAENAVRTHEARAERIARRLAPRLAAEPGAARVAALEHALNDLGREGDVAYARILGPDHQVVAKQVFWAVADTPGAVRDVGQRVRHPEPIQWADGLDRHVVDLFVPVEADDALRAEQPVGQPLLRELGFVQVGIRVAGTPGARPIPFREQLGAAGLLAAILVGLAWLGGRRLTGRMRQLAAVTRDIAAGQFDRRVDVGGSDEVGHLARGLDVMIERLRDYRGQLEGRKRNLEEQVRERTAQLETRTEEAMELAREAEESSLAKSQFLANMSHEIRTPMNGVLGMTELLLETQLDERQRGFTQTAHRSAEMLLGVINDILDFSKAEAGKLELEPRTCEIRETLNQVADVVAEASNRKGVELIIHVSDDVPFAIRCDPVRLRQVITNLVGNAVKFTEEGSVTVTLTRLPHPDDQAGFCRLEFAVADTGIGIAKEVRDRIFQSFTQADGSMARRYGGTGLGLPIARQLVEMMDGQLRFESEPGRGSRFWFTIPAEIAEEQLPAGAAPARPEESALANVRSLRLRVLLAEDNVVNQEVAVALLESLDCEVELVAHGKAAVKAAGHGFDIVLMDCQMPQMDGIEATRRIRRAGVCARDGKRIPIVAVTAHAMRHDREKCFAAGMDAYISKPFGRRELADTLGTWRRSGPEPAHDLASKTAARVDGDTIAELRQLEKTSRPGLVGSLVEKFRTSSAKLLRQIEDGVAAGDAGTVGEAAHALKSSSAQLGARQVSELALVLEQAARNADLENAPELEDQLGHAIEEALAALDAVVCEENGS